jgi:DNA-binding MarR family transcriptional regulator
MSGNAAHLAALSALLARDPDTGSLGPKHLLILAFICQRQSVHSVAEVASLLDIDRSGASRALERLVQRRLVTRADDPDDRRRAVIVPTREGQELDAKVQGYVTATAPEAAAA